VSTAFLVNVTIGTSLATVVLIVFFDGIGDSDSTHKQDSQAHFMVVTAIMVTTSELLY
jgi:hypothetical protein